jgi:hypothetical protein
MGEYQFSMGYRKLICKLFVQIDSANVTRSSRDDGGLGVLEKERAGRPSQDSIPDHSCVSFMSSLTRDRNAPLIKSAFADTLPHFFRHATQKWKIFLRLAEATG